MIFRRATPVKPPAASEQAIQRAIFQHLKVRGAPNTFAFHPANGGYRRPVEASILTGLGVKAGTPDIIAIREGRCFALELKADEGKLSDRQREVLDLMAAAGAEVGVAHGLDAALRWLEDRGLLRGRTT